MPIMIMSEQQKNNFKKHWWQWALCALAVVVFLFAAYVDLDCSNDTLPASGGAAALGERG